MTDKNQLEEHVRNCQSVPMCTDRGGAAGWEYCPVAKQMVEGKYGGAADTLLSLNDNENKVEE